MAKMDYNRPVLKIAKGLDRERKKADNQPKAGLYSEKTLKLFARATRRMNRKKGKPK